MTAPMTEAEIREALARAERARRHVNGLCIGTMKWRMRVPPQADDSDLVICNALDDSKRLAADLLAARAERDEARAAHESERRVYGEDVRINATRAETAEARCRELEGVLAWSHRQAHSWIEHARMCFDAVPSSDDVAFLARGDALLSPPPPHTCQMSRATSGASDCGLSPCEEAAVHRDRGASRPAETATPESAMERMCRENREAMAARYGPNWDCKTCGGSGRVVRDNGINPVHGEPVEIEEPCPTCGGA